jgi:hypothetical protein
MFVFQETPLRHFFGFLLGNNDIMFFLGYKQSTQNDEYATEILFESIKERASGLEPLTVLEHY